MIDKDIISKRKEQYGNNFPLIAELWNNYLSITYDIDISLSPEDISAMMSLMKISRLANSPQDKDSLIDLFNYAYIAINYNEYLTLDIKH